MHRSRIEWVLNPDNKTLGWVWNPITGCLNGCSYCYARKLAKTRLRKRYLANGLVACNYEGGEDGSDSELKAAFADPFYPRFWPERLQDPCHYNREGIIDYDSCKGIFVCNMGDLFGKGIPEEWQENIFKTIDYCPDDRFYLLTKQPQNLHKFSPFPDNCWVGVSATNYQMFTSACDMLHCVKAPVKFISFEPLFDLEFGGPNLNFWMVEGGISQVIIGAQTKPYKPPQIELVKDIVEAADKVGVAVFLKDNLGALLRQADMDNPFWNNPRWKLLRQEMPDE